MSDTMTRVDTRTAQGPRPDGLSHLALGVSFAMSAIGIAVSLVGWAWANGQRINYAELELGIEITNLFSGSWTEFTYVPIYLLLMLVGGGVALVLALVGARATGARPWLAALAGAMAMFVVMVPVLVLVMHEINHWIAYPGD